MLFRRRRQFALITLFEGGVRFVDGDITGSEFPFGFLIGFGGEFFGLIYGFTGDTRQFSKFLPSLSSFGTFR